MDRKRSGFILVLLGLLIFYELFNNSSSLFLIIIGLISFFLSNRFSGKKQNIFMLVSLLSLSLALFTSRLFLVFLIILALLFIGNNLDFYVLIRDVFSKRRLNKHSNDFIMVTFDKGKVQPAKIMRNKWFRDDSKSVDSIYSWEDINFTKVIGDTVFDLGNTLLPKGQNIILIRKVAGDTKIIVPEEIAVSLDISILVGKISIKEEEYTLFNENFKWHSDNYQISDRKIKIVSNVLLGELEVIFL